MLREKLGWTQEELVNQLRLRGVDVSRSMIAKIESGKIDLQPIPRKTRRKSRRRYYGEKSNSIDSEQGLGRTPSKG